jgi:hypothetical protein
MKAEVPTETLITSTTATLSNILKDSNQPVCFPLKHSVLCIMRWCESMIVKHWRLGRYAPDPPRLINRSWRRPVQSLTNYRGPALPVPPSQLVWCRSETGRAIKRVSVCHALSVILSCLVRNSSHVSGSCFSQGPVKFELSFSYGRRSVN